MTTSFRANLILARKENSNCQIKSPKLLLLNLPLTMKEKYWSWYWNGTRPGKYTVTSRPFKLNGLAGFEDGVLNLK